MALRGIDPILTGELLAHLDAMGHSDAVVVADANFPAYRLGSRLVDLPGLSSPEVLRAICTVVPPDDPPALDLMLSADGVQLPVQRELIEAARVGPDAVRMLERESFYAAADSAYVIVRTGERRIYANALLRKGVVT
jgi:L-fucose mutarotase